MSKVEARRAPAGARRRWFLLMLRRSIARAFSKERGGFEQPRLWLFAVVIGVLVGYASVFFFWAIDALNHLIFEAGQGELVDGAIELQTLTLVAAPALGGLIVGLIFSYACHKPDPMTVTDVIEARALAGGRLPIWRGVVSTIASALSLGFGASAGREGPVVVAGATISSIIARFVSLNVFERRALLGCAVAAAVSASFNAPIAGALFALEVVLGHYAVRVFAPITIASVIGAVIGRAYLGDAPAFAVPSLNLVSIAEFPSFCLLGPRRSGCRHGVHDGDPGYARPDGPRADAFGSADLGADRVGWRYRRRDRGVWRAAGPQRRLSGDRGCARRRIHFWGCVGIAIAKTIASAVTMGGRFAGGVFSPALMLGALTGSAFGAVATYVVPGYADHAVLYALAGMGAVAGAVLGAPISTTLIVFELTSSYAVAISAMISTSVATVATQQIFRKSFFHWQLARRGLDLISEPAHVVMRGLVAGDHMRWRGSENGAPDSTAWELARQGVWVAKGDDFRAAFKHFSGATLSFLPVLDPEKDLTDDDALVGALFYVDALAAYNRALVQLHQEEHS